MSSSIPYSKGDWKLLKGNIESNNKIVARVFAPNDVNIENLCNASLMVSAPKMYEALKLLMNDDSSHISDDVLLIITKAINKAEEVKLNAVLRLDEG